MTPAQQTQKDLEALVVDCPELRTLDSELGRFNIFRVLRSTKNELRHSNMLAWLLNPSESHGLGDRFFRRWLMTVVHANAVEGAPSAVDVDASEIRSVDVAREWNHIDVLVKVRLQDGRRWVIAIENKINANQSETQLEGYRTLVERLFPDCQRLFVFLTMFEEQPDDAAWVRSDYSLVAEVLDALVLANRERIGPDPLVLISHYLRTIREHAMGDEKLVELARTIYRTHQRALDYIFQQREDPLSELSNALLERMKASSLGLVPRLCQKEFVRFLPREWNVPKNLAGTAWGGVDSAYLLCEITLRNQVPALKFVEGAAPKEWRTKLFAQLQANATLLNVGRTKMPAQWMTVFSRKLVAREADDDVELAADKIWASCEAVLKSDDFQRSVAIFTPLLDELPDPPEAG